MLLKFVAASERRSLIFLLWFCQWSAPVSCSFIIYFPWISLCVKHLSVVDNIYLHSVSQTCCTYKMRQCTVVLVKDQYFIDLLFASCQVWIILLMIKAAITFTVSPQLIWGYSAKNIKAIMLKTFWSSLFNSPNSTTDLPKMQINSIDKNELIHKFTLKSWNNYSKINTHS